MHLIFLIHICLYDYRHFTICVHICAMFLCTCFFHPMLTHWHHYNTHKCTHPQCLGLYPLKQCDMCTSVYYICLYMFPHLPSISTFMLILVCGSIQIHTCIHARLMFLHICLDMYTYVTRFYKTDPNCTSGKIKLTPPVDSYTIVLLVLIPNYMGLVLTDVFSGWYGELEWQFLVL